VRVTDTRGWSGERFAYRLILRAPEPDFDATLATKGAVSVPAGSGVQFVVKVDRKDGWDGNVQVEAADVPPGFFISKPIVVQAGRLTGVGCLYALPDAKQGAVDFSKVKWTATAKVNGKVVAKPVTGLDSVVVAAAPKQAIFMEPDISGKPQGDGRTVPAKPYEVTIAPGGRVSVWLRVDRHGNDAVVSLDVDGAPHGVIVDSIGLNGVQIRAGENEREIFLSCANWVPEQDHLIQVVTGSAGAVESVEGLQSSFPVLLKVRKASPNAVAMGAKQ
jgi:hypothetical protein